MLRLAFIFLALVFAPAAHADPPNCVIPLVGQSNSPGNGNVAQSVIGPFMAANFTDGGSIAHAYDPLCAACNGSMWPAFGAEFHNQTGAFTLFVQTAIGGGILSSAYAASQSVTAHWGATGTLVAAAFTKIDAAISLMAGYGTTMRVCGVVFVQGESEGEAIVNSPGVTSGADWKAEFANLVARFRTKYGSTVPFWIIKLGTAMPSDSDTNSAHREPDAREPGFAQIRLAQEQSAIALDRVVIVSRMSLECAMRYGLHQGLHYTQECNNRMGADAGRRAAESGLWK